MSDSQSLIDNALFEYDKADNEVERLLDVIDRATIQLEEARQIKRSAKIRLDEAIASAFRVPLSLSLEEDEYKDSSCSDSYYSSVGEPSVHSSGSSGSEEDDEEGERSVSDNRSASHSVVEDDDDDDFDIADEALEQIRYRLNAAKINPSSIQGASILDQLLIRLKDTDDTISNDLIDEIMNDLLGNQKESHVVDDSSVNEDNYHDDSQEEDNHDENIRIEISRGGKVLGFYEGGLDERGYSREGEGIMYYNAGHIYSGNWIADVQAGYGVYQWTDGHVYEGEWMKGKRHGLGRFTRPDGVVLFGRYEDGRQVGEGVRWSADNKEAQIVEDGEPKGKIDLSDAYKMKKELGFDEDELP